jgi:gliding motility-associated-like protein
MIDFCNEIASFRVFEISACRSRREPSSWVIFIVSSVPFPFNELIDSLNGLNDTIYVDSLLDTKNEQYSYKIEFYNDQPGNRFLIGQPEIASSVYLKTIALDNEIVLNWNYNVPWINDSAVVYRQNSTGGFDSLGIAYGKSFVDTSLKNGAEYCYRVRTIGHYSINQIINPIYNFSQVKCDIPVDTVKPCSPTLSVASHCDEEYNLLNWNVSDTCTDDIVGFNIYYTPFINGTPDLIANVQSNVRTYSHFPPMSMAGCYTIISIDSVGNESSPSVRVCVDSCSYYELPNVFTPNGDGINDVFKPAPYKFVDHINLKIYNRWGTLVYETTDPDINWDGRLANSDKKVSPGVYYYVCDVYEYRLTGIVPRTITGFVHIFYGKDEKNINP